MRHVPSIICLVVLATSALGCKSAAQRQQEEGDRNQTATMQRMLSAETERGLEGGAAPATARPDPGSSGEK